MKQNLHIGKKVHVDFINGGSADGIITLIGDMSTEDGTEKLYQIKVTEDNYINVCECQIEEIYDAYSPDNCEEFLEYISVKYLLGKLELENCGTWLPVVWNMLDEDEKAQLTAFFSSREVVVSAMDMVVNFEKEVLAIIREYRKNTPKKREEVISRFYGNRKK